MKNLLKLIAKFAGTTLKRVLLYVGMFFGAYLGALLLDILLNIIVMVILPFLNNSKYTDTAYAINNIAVYVFFLAGICFLLYLDYNRAGKTPGSKGEYVAGAITFCGSYWLFALLGHRLWTSPANFGALMIGGCNIFKVFQNDSKSPTYILIGASVFTLLMSAWHFIMYRKQHKNQL